MGTKSTDNSIARVNSQLEYEILEKFRQRLKKEIDLVCPTDDCYLLKFLRAANLDTDVAFLKLTNWWKERHRVKEVYDGLSPSKFKSLYDLKYTRTLAQRDELGRQIVVWNMAKDWNSIEHSALEVLTSSFPVMDAISNRQLTQLNGLVIILDLQAFCLSHAKCFGPWLIRTFINQINNFPIKVKAVHLINHPIIFNILWNCSKFMVKPKLRNRVQFHGNDYNSLHKCISAKVLPVSYGGILTEGECEETGFTQSLIEKENYYNEFFNLFGYKSILICK